jgi:uncharacterized protein YggT (Ycf19 family)
MTDLSWMHAAYNTIALVLVFLLMYVMQKTEHDRVLNKLDSPLMQWFRRLTFVIAALVLCYTILYPNWLRTALLLVSAGTILVGVNAIILRKRVPPANSGMMVRNFIAGMAHRKSRS